MKRKVTTDDLFMLVRATKHFLTKNGHPNVKVGTSLKRFNETGVVTLNVRGLAVPLYTPPLMSVLTAIAPEGLTVALAFPEEVLA